MPEAAIAEAPPAQSQSVGGPTATSLFAQQMADLAAKEVESSPEAAPEAKPSPEAKPEPVKEPAAEAPKEAAPKEPKQTATEKQMAEWTQKDFDEAMKKAPSKAWKVYEFYKNKTEAKLAEAEKQKAVVQAKPESPANDKRLEVLEKQIKDYTEQLSGRDKTIAELEYTRSSEFQDKYVAGYRQMEAMVSKALEGLMITEGESQRAATKADFVKLMKRDIGDQFDLVKQWLGDSSAAQRILINLNRMEEIKLDAERAREVAQSNAEQNRTKSELKTKQDLEMYKTELEAERNSLTSQFPQFFGDTDDQKISEAQEKARGFAIKALAERDSSSPREKALYDAAIIEAHGYAHRAALEVKGLEAEVETLKKELARYRKSDPGSAGDGKAPAIVDNGELGGIAGMSSHYKKE